MEIEKAHGKEGHVFFAEAFGTCFLVYAINMQAEFASFGVFGIAMTLFMCILLWGNISGGNFNPAVTLGVLLANPS
jgi:glycerol uptake facilitator-like aquaporin